MPLPYKPVVILGEHERVGGPPILDGFILTGTDNYTLARFRIDTGADRTLIGPGDREALGIDLESLPLSDQVTITANGLVRMHEVTIGLGFRTLDGALAHAGLTVAVAPHQISDYEAPSLLGLDFLYRLNLTVEPTHSRLQGLAPYDSSANTYSLERRIPS